jgi:CheY-like chemotaxis protein
MREQNIQSVIIAVTGQIITQEVADLLRDSGVDDIVFKPATKEKISQCVTYWRATSINAVLSGEVRLANIHRDVKQAMLADITNRGVRASREYERQNLTPSESKVDVSMSGHDNGIEGDRSIYTNDGTTTIIGAEPLPNPNQVGSSSHIITMDNVADSRPCAPHSLSLLPEPRPEYIRQTTPSLSRRATSSGTPLPASSEVELSQKAISPRRTQILVVDDSTPNRNILVKMVQQISPQNEVTEASNGLDAVKLCSQKAFALIFMDLDMPVMKG